MKILIEFSRKPNTLEAKINTRRISEIHWKSPILCQESAIKLATRIYH